MARNNHIFVSFAAEDKWYRDALAQQAKDERSPFTFTDMSLQEPFDTKWKTQCRARISICDGMIALISKKTWNADGAKWEMACANEEGVPLIGVHIHKDDRGVIPSELDGKKVIEWTWAGIKSFLDSL